MAHPQPDRAAKSSQEPLLLYRAQLSKKNRWIDSEGRIYIQFSNASLAKALHKCEASVRNALRELEKAGLIEKRSNAGSANTIYLKLPDSSESQPKPRLKTDTPPCQKTSTLPCQKTNTRRTFQCLVTPLINFLSWARSPWFVFSVPL